MKRPIVKPNIAMLAILAACAVIGMAHRARAVKLCLGTPTVWASGISVSPSSGTISSGGSAAVAATVAPPNATSKVVMWSSSNSGVASVVAGGANNATGTVYGNSAGTAYIYAKTSPSATLDGTQFTATYTVTVQDPYLCSSCHPNLKNICSDDFSSDDGHCRGRSSNAGAQTFDGSLCPSPMPGTIYGKSRCSSQSDSGYDYRNPRPVAYDPPNNNGAYCWCQLCDSSARTTCGAWVYHSGMTGTCTASDGCADTCAYRISHSNSLNGGVRRALCSAP